MVNKLTEAISRALDEAFGDGCTIYADDVEQGFKEPCFYIQPIHASRTQLVGRRYRVGNSFDVMYFPEPSSALQSNVNGVHEMMFDICNSSGNTVD